MAKNDNKCHRMPLGVLENLEGLQRFTTNFKESLEISKNHKESELRISMNLKESLKTLIVNHKES